MSALEPLSDIESAYLARELTSLVASVAPSPDADRDDDGLCLVCREIDCGGHAGAAGTGVAP